MCVTGDKCCPISGDGGRLPLWARSQSFGHRGKAWSRSRCEHGTVPGDRPGSAMLGVTDHRTHRLGLMAVPLPTAMKTLYLDFDAVLHPSSATRETHCCQMHLLEKALHGRSCQIVASSSWRFHHPCKSIANLFPESLRDRVIGCTGPAYRQVAPL